MGVFILNSGGGIDGARFAPSGYDARKGTYIVYSCVDAGLGTGETETAVLTYVDGVQISADGSAAPIEQVSIDGQVFVGYGKGCVIQVDD